MHTVENRRELQIPTLEEAKQMLGGKLPSAIINTIFDSDGFVRTSSKRMVPLYLANGLGFNAPGRHFINNVLKPELTNLGFFVFDPFEQCGEFVDTEVLFDRRQTVGSQGSLWHKFNTEVIPTVNYGLLLPRSKVMLAIMEGHTTDEGVAAEVAYMASNFGPVVGARTDFRLAENPATGSNPAVTFFMSPQYGGAYFEGPQAYDKAYNELSQIASKLLT